jgi:hypothetical protein
VPCLALRVFGVKWTTISADFDKRADNFIRDRRELLIDRDQGLESA